MYLPNSPWLRWSVFVCLGLLLVVLWSTLKGFSALTPTLDPLPQDPYIKVYFNHNPASVYTEPYRSIRRYGDNLEQVVIDAIQEAQHSIDVAVQEFNLPLIAKALSDRQAAGVRVRLILEDDYSTSWASYRPSGIAELDEHRRGKYNNFLALADLNKDGVVDESERQQRDALYMLTKARIPHVDDTADGSKGSGLMHHKFMIIDGHKVLTGSANWTLSGVHGDLAAPESRGNANAMVVIDSYPLAEIFQEEFDLMWGDGPEGQKDSLFGLQKPYRRPRQLSSIPGSAITVQFSPTSESQPWSESVNGLIGKTLQQAQTSVDMSLFVFSDQAISNSLAKSAQRGVTVRSLIDSSFAYRSYSESLDMLGTAMRDHRCQFEANNQPWSTPIHSVGMPQLPEGDKLHHKFALIDHTTVVIGSQNWSNAANSANDENLLIIRNPTVAAHFKREFERLYETAKLGMTPKLQAKLTESRQRCS